MNLLLIQFVFGLLGLLTWAAFVRFTDDDLTLHQFFLYLLGFGLVFRLLLVVTVPTFYAPDEQAHYRYVEFLVTNHRLPTLAVPGEYTYEFYQPPLYYLALTPIYWIVHDLLGASTWITVRALRLPSVLLWASVLSTAVRLVDFLQLWRKGVPRAVSGFVLSMVTFLPTYVFLSSTMNNDNLIIALGAVATIVLFKSLTIRNAEIMGLIVGAGLITKNSAVVFAFAVGGVALARWRLHRSTLTEAAGYVGVVGAVSGVIWAPVAIRNYLTYGSATAMKVGNAQFQWTWDSTNQAVYVSLRYMVKSFWAVAGIYNNVTSEPLWLVGLGILFVGSMGFAWRVVLRGGIPNLSLDERDAVTLVGFVPAIAVNVLLVFRMGLLYRQSQGRFLYPLLVPIVLLLAFGINHEWLTSRLEGGAKHWVGFFVTYLTTFIGYSLILFYYSLPN